MRADEYECCNRYDVSERKLLIGTSAPFSAGKETKLKQNSLFACTKSYVARSITASCPGLCCD